MAQRTDPGVFYTQGFQRGTAVENSGTYAANFQAFTGQGVFRGCDGHYKGAADSFVFALDWDGVTGPATGAAVLGRVAVTGGGGAAGNFYMYPIRYFFLGVYIALSTTGDHFTASANTDMTVLCDHF